jgi:dTDP-4-dehydrorhamnose reductase
MYMNGVNGQVGSALHSRLAMLLPQPPIKLSSHPSSESDLFHDLLQREDSACRQMKNGDIFLFLASYCNYNLCEKNPELAYAVNVKGTVFLLDSLLQRGVKVIFFSSASVYGNSELPFDENSSLNGKSVYAETKRYIEERYSVDPNVKILRPSTIIANDDNFIRYVRSCELKNISAEIFLGIISSPIGILDISKVIMKLCENWDSAPQIMNLCGPDVAGKDDIASIYKKSVNSDFRYTVVSPPKEYTNGRDVKTPLNPKRLAAFYGKPLTPLQSTIIAEYALSGTSFP